MLVELPTYEEAISAHDSYPLRERFPFELTVSVGWWSSYRRWEMGPGRSSSS